MNVQGANISRHESRKAWFDTNRLIVGVGARDALEARLIEEAGFDFVWAGSLAVSASYAIPDASLISMSQFLAAARSMREAVRIPVVVDGDTGYGDARNVAYAVRLFEEAGLAGVCFEDKRFPKENSLLANGNNGLISVAEFADKIRAAVETRRNAHFAILARVEALVSGAGQEEALSRSAAYVAAGADLVFIHSKSRTPGEILEFIERWDGNAPLVLAPTTYSTLTEAQVGRYPKVRMLIYANHALRAGIRAQQEVLKEIRRVGGIHTIDDQIVPLERIFALQQPDWLRRRNPIPERV